MAPLPPDTICWRRLWQGSLFGCLPCGLVMMSLLLPARAGVVFENCQPAAGGGVSCDTRPTGNTLADDEAARYGLFNEASPGWAEFDPYEGYDDMFGGNWT